MASDEKSWNKVDGVKALIESGITKLPSFYVKPQEQRISFQDLHQDLDKDEIPIIDLNDLHDGSPERRASIIAELLSASEKWGFFRVINHGVDHVLMEDMLDATREFFQMPLDVKMSYYSEDINAPVRYGSSFSPLIETIFDWQDHLLQRFLPENGSEPHPWPTKPPSYRKTAEEFFNRVRCLAKQLLGALSEGMGLEEERLETLFGKQQTAFRMNYYPPCPAPELVMGLSPHSDIGGLTILLLDQNPGLQVKIDGKWKTVKPVPGALVVNIADQLQIFSNGRLKSVEHRAFANADQARVSVGLFFDPSSDVEVAPIPELLDTVHPALYQPCVYGDYINIRFNKPLIGKDLVDSMKTES